METRNHVDIAFHLPAALAALPAASHTTLQVQHAGSLQGGGGGLGEETWGAQGGRQDVRGGGGRRDALDQLLSLLRGDG